MMIKDRINDKIKMKMLSLSYLATERNTKQRTALKGSYFADSIEQIRKLSKPNLAKYIKIMESKESVVLANKIAHSSSSAFYRKVVSQKDQQNIELINYAHNKLMVTNAI
tara:strand:+ start:430 stop:759 length:330 start_codon:yes stop_codon:yes gene_type:complete